MSNNNVVAERLTRGQAAAYLGVTKQTLETWASVGRYNLPFHKIGSRVQYFKSDLDSFIASRRVTNTRKLDDAAATATPAGDGPSRHRRGARRQKQIAAAGIQ